MQQVLSKLVEFLGQEKFQCHTQGTQIGHQVKQIVENLPQNYTQVICFHGQENWLWKNY
jgi:hypothetical protein